MKLPLPSPLTVVSNKRLYSIIFIASVIGISFILFFYLQDIIERDTKDRLVAQQIGNQMEATKRISVHISSDLNSIVVALHGLANSVYVQQGQLSDDKTKNLLEETYLQINTITVVDRLFILDKKNIATAFIVPRGQSEPFFGSDNISFEELVNQTRAKTIPTFSNGLKGLDNKYRIAITYPILNRDTQEYIGSIVALIPAIEFFEHYGNVHDITAQYLTAYDRNGTYLANPSAYFAGKNFFADDVQKLINYNKNFNDIIRKVVLYGQPSQTIYDYGIGERLGTGYPILEQGKPTYFVFVNTPTSIIYSEINQVLLLERVEIFLLLAGTTAAVTFLIVFLLRWSRSLGREVKRRTMELEELNRQLASANEQLKTNDKIQKEFINVAAHELRTPLQPIISYCALALRDKVDKNEAMQIIDKHAHRLHKLTTDLLAVIRIEGGAFPYKREKININDLILDVINNAVAKKAKKNDNNNIITRDDNNSNKKREEKDNGNKKGLLVEEWGEGEEQDKVLIEVNLDRTVKEIYADKDRIFEVLSNVIDNALKFTKKGKIKIESHGMIQDQQEGDNNNNNNKIEIKVSDTGAGIPEDILPHLFGKFVAKNVIGKESRQGSGLGLFISKAIVKAHNGEITAHNNESGSGATVSIVLPTGGTNINSDSDGNCNC
jgi:signal transduction histidine kinase